MRENLSFKELLVLGGGLFSMHFGAGCLLYPVTWGADAGSAVFWTYAGIFLSAVVLPFLGYVALVRGGGNFLTLICRPAPKFGLCAVALTILILGPFFMMPRITAALWSAILQLTGTSGSFASQCSFNGLLYLAVFLFVSGKGKVVECIGKIFFPLLVVIVTAVIAQSMATPLASRVPPVFSDHPVVHGFIAGYAAGDLQCALAYGLVAVQGIRNAGIAPRRVGANLLKVCVVGLGLLALAHLGHMIAGANTGGTIRLNLSALYVQMVVNLWGSAGGLVFLAALATASLTATMGVASSTASLWEEIFNGRLSYGKICALTCVLACMVSSAGLDPIISVIGPVLDACYPVSIVLSLYYCLCGNCLKPGNLRAARASLIAAALTGGVGLIHGYAMLFNLRLPGFERFYAALPLSSVSLAWVPLSAAAYAAAWLWAWRSRRVAAAENA